MKFIKIINRILTIVLIISFTLTLVVYTNPVNALSQVFETEENDNYSTADETSNESENVGSISTWEDIDWWKVTFSSEGMANIWLGNIPEGCDYEMLLYTSDNFSAAAAISIYYGNLPELIRCHVVPNVTYYIKIYSVTGYSEANYTLRIRNYPIDNTAKVFTTYHEYNEYGELWVDSSYYRETMTYSTRNLNGALTHLNNMGFPSGEYLNNSANGIHRTIPQVAVFINGSHGNPGFIIQGRPGAPISRLYAQENSNMVSSDKALSTYYHGELSKTHLFISTSCYGGTTDTTYGNVIDTVMDKGCMIAIGWADEVNTVDSGRWVVKLMEFLETGSSVGKAMAQTDQFFRNIQNEEFDSRTLNSRYTGSSKTYSLVLGKLY